MGWARPQLDCHDRILGARRESAALLHFCLLALCLLCCSWQTSFAAETETLSPVQSKDLLLLENRYFGHGFEKEDALSRAERLEKLVYGEPADGSATERLTRLAELLRKDEESVESAEIAASASKDGSADGATGSDRQKSQAGSNDPGKRQQAEREPEKKAATGQTMQTSSRSLNDEESMELASYPHIDDLEYLILGSISKSQPLSARMNALETKAFGAPSMAADLSRRTDALDQYVERKLSKDPYKSRQQEQAAFAFPSQASARQSPGAESRTKTVSKKVIAGMANTLLSASGLGMFGVSPMSMAQNRQPANTGNSGIAYVDRLSKKEAEERSLDFEAGPSQNQAMNSNLDSGGNLPAEGEEAISQMPAPPPESARLSVKVSWCETRLFGRTFLDMHLTDRLRQLSKELNCLTQVTDFELMDQIQALMALVQERYKKKSIVQKP